MGVVITRVHQPCQVLAIKANVSISDHNSKSFRTRGLASVAAANREISGFLVRELNPISADFAVTQFRCRRGRTAHLVPNSPASLRYMGSRLHAETGCRKVYAGEVFE